MVVGVLGTDSEVLGGESVGWFWEKGRRGMWGTGRELVGGEGKGVVVVLYGNIVSWK